MKSRPCVHGRQTWIMMNPQVKTTIVANDNWEVEVGGGEGGDIKSMQYKINFHFK